MDRFIAVDEELATSKYRLPFLKPYRKEIE